MAFGTGLRRLRGLAIASRPAPEQSVHEFFGAVLDCLTHAMPRLPHR